MIAKIKRLWAFLGRLNKAFKRAPYPWERPDKFFDPVPRHQRTKVMVELMRGNCVVFCKSDGKESHYKPESVKWGETPIVTINETPRPSDRRG